MGQRVKKASILPSFGTWAGVCTLSAQPGGELSVRCCQGIPVMSAGVEHGAEEEERISSVQPPSVLHARQGLWWAAVGCNQGAPLPPLLPCSQSSPSFFVCFSFIDVHCHVHWLELKLLERSSR